MPLNPGAPVSNTIRELHGGKIYAHTAEKFGKERANRQAIAIAMQNARRATGGVVPHFDAGGGVSPVTAIIQALQQGTGAGAGASGMPAPPIPNTTNQAAPSSPAITNQATNPSGVVPTGTSAASMMPAAMPASGSATGVAPVPPIAKPLMASGGALKRDMGGMSTLRGPTQGMPWYEKNEVRNLHVGPVLSAVPGRTDNHAVKVPAGSYVLPAQHVASMGHGNTLAGMAAANKMFGSPHLPSMSGGGGGAPRPPAMPHFASGGYSEGGARGAGHFEPVDVDISGGEYVIHPQTIIAKFGSLKNGHRILDKWVMDTRKKEIETQKRLPPPAKK